MGAQETVTPQGQSTSPGGKPKRWTCGSLLGCCIGVLVLLLGGWALASAYLIPSWLQARYIDGMKGGVYQAQFALTEAGKPVILADEAIMSRSTSRSSSRVYTFGYNYHWLVVIDPLTGRLLKTSEPGGAIGKDGLRFFGGTPGRVWATTGGSFELWDPATLKILESSTTLRAKLGKEAGDALYDNDAVPEKGTGNLVLFDDDAPRWLLETKTLKLRELPKDSQPKLLYESPSRTWASSDAYTWVRLPNGSRFEIENDGGARNARLRITDPDGTQRDAEQFTEPSGATLVCDQISRAPIWVDGPLSVFIGAYNSEKRLTRLSRVSADGRRVWLVTTGDLPDPVDPTKEVGVRAARMIENHLVVVMDERLVSFDPGSGRVEWTYGSSVGGRGERLLYHLRRRIGLR